MSHLQSQVPQRVFNPGETLTLSGRAEGNTETRICGVLPLPLPLVRAIAPSVLAENQVLNALRLGFQLIPVFPRPRPLFEASVCEMSSAVMTRTRHTELHKSDVHPGAQDEDTANIQPLGFASFLSLENEETDCSTRCKVASIWTQNSCSAIE